MTESEVPKDQAAEGNPTDNPPIDQANNQIRDALSQLNAILGGADQSVFQVAAYQAVSQAIALTLQNAVAQQQHAHILRMSLTTAAANAILDGRKVEAESLLDLAASKLVTPNLSEMLSQVQSCVRSIGEELYRIKHGVPAQPKPETPTEPASA
jgi:hypothetical protein